MSFQKDSFDRKAAAEVASQIAERIRANYDGFTAGRLQPDDASDRPGARCDPGVRECAGLHFRSRSPTATGRCGRSTCGVALPVSGAYLEAPANSTQMKLTLAWQEGQATDGQRRSDLQRRAGQHPTIRSTAASRGSCTHDTPPSASHAAAGAAPAWPHADRTADRDRAQPADHRGGRIAVLTSRVGRRGPRSSRAAPRSAAALRCSCSASPSRWRGSATSTAARCRPASARSHCRGRTCAPAATAASTIRQTWISPVFPAPSPGDALFVAFQAESATGIAPQGTAAAAGTVSAPPRRWSVMH